MPQIIVTGNGALASAVSQLVPARMVMLGKHTWYLPRWLGRILPRINIEGTDYFQARDQIPAATQAQHSASEPSPVASAKDS